MSGRLAHVSTPLRLLVGRNGAPRSVVAAGRRTRDFPDGRSRRRHGPSVTVEARRSVSCNACRGSSASPAEPTGRHDARRGGTAPVRLQWRGRTPISGAAASARHDDGQRLRRAGTPTTGSRDSRARHSRSRPTSSSMACGHPTAPEWVRFRRAAVRLRDGRAPHGLGVSRRRARPPRSNRWCSARGPFPRLAACEITVRVDRPADIAIAAGIDPADVPGRGDAHAQPQDQGPNEGVDGRLLWHSAGRDLDARAWPTRRRSVATRAARSQTATRDERGWFSTTYRVRARTDRPYRVTHIAASVPPSRTPSPTSRLAGSPRSARGADSTDCGTRTARCWNELWKGRITIDGADARWQAITDASIFYLLSSVHSSSLASTSLFGLAYWPNYHYYHGHVMWDIETFTVPPLLLLAPDAARALLDYRHRHLAAARQNAVAPRLARRDVSVGELPGPRRGGDAGRAAIHRGPRQPRTSPSRSPRTSTRPATWTTRDGSPGPCSDPSPSSSASRVIRTAPRLRDRGHRRAAGALRAGRQQRLHEHGGCHGAAAGRRRSRAPIGETPPAGLVGHRDGLVLPRDTRRGSDPQSRWGAGSMSRRAECPEGAAGLFPVGYPRVGGRSSWPPTDMPPTEQAPLYVGAPMLSALAAGLRGASAASRRSRATSSNQALATSSTSRSSSRTSTLARERIAPGRPRCSPT